MKGDYFDLEDYRCEEHHVRIRFTSDVPWSAELQSLTMQGDSMENNSEHVIANNTIMEVPFWLATVFVENQVAIFLTARAFSAKSRAQLLADAEAVNLSDLTGSSSLSGGARKHYYGLGYKLAPLQPGEQIGTLLRETLRARLGMLARGSFSPTSISGCASKPSDAHGSMIQSTGPVTRLDHMEMVIYKAALAARRDIDRWASRQRKMIRPFDIHTSNEES